MAMAVGFVVVNSLTFSVKSVINMDMRQLYSNQHPNQYKKVPTTKITQNALKYKAQKKEKDITQFPLDMHSYTISF